MILGLGFDPLFTILTFLFTLSPTAFNLVFLASTGTFKMNFVQYHMQFLWSLAFVQSMLNILTWHILQGNFA